MVGRYCTTLRRFGKKPHHSCAGLYETIRDRPGPPHRQGKQDDDSDREHRERTQI
jgi:hypothetical protein